MDLLDSAYNRRHPRFILDSQPCFLLNVWLGSFTACLVHTSDILSEIFTALQGIPLSPMKPYLYGSWRMRTNTTSILAQKKWLAVLFHQVACWMRPELPISKEQMNQWGSLGWNNCFLTQQKPDGTWSSQVPPETRRDQQKVGDLKSDCKESSPGPMKITEAKPNHLAFFLLKLFGVLGISNLKGSCFSKLEGPQPSSIAGLSEKWWRPGGCDLQGGKYNDCG